ncbi:MAG: hypothetical protein WKF37_23315 [Bryobacteraceae bacterium]
MGWNHVFNPTVVLEVKFGYNNPTNPNLGLGRSLSRIDFLNKAGIQMFQPDVISDQRPPNFNAQGEFGVGGGGSVTTDNIYQGIANLALEKERTRLNLE